MMTLKNDNK
jgi:hypothetical protein